MKLLPYLLKNINLLNIALAGLITAGFFYIFAPTPVIDLKVTPAPNKLLSETKEVLSQAQNIPPSDYTIISEQNIFHPDRKIPTDKKIETQKSQPEFVLYGTLIADDIRLAYLEDKKSPRTTQGRGNRQTALKKGETISGFTLNEIEKDKIVMVREEETIIVHLTDSSKAKSRGGTSAPGVQTQPAPASAVQTKAEEKKPAAPQPTAAKPDTEKKQFASEKEKTATESARKSLLDFFKQPQAR